MVSERLHDISESFSREALQRLWADLNALYFDQRLPPIQILWSSRLTSTAGLFVSQHGPRDRWITPEERHGVGRVIRLSLPLHRRQPLSTIRNTLAHEMIHQWQFDVKKCRPSHGPEFRRLMNLMNRDGLGISIYHTLHKEVDALAKYAWQCVGCGRSYARQRKSLSVHRHRCGECHGMLREMSPVGITGVVGETQVPTVDVEDHSPPSANVPVQLSFRFFP